MVRRTSITGFRGDTNASISIIFAFAVLVIIAALGLTLDFGRASSGRVALQAALDAATIAAASSAYQESGDFDTIATSFANANWKSSVSIDDAHFSVVKQSDDLIVGTATGTVPTTFFAALGQDSIQVSARSGVKIGSGPVEIVLALDTTASMNGTKLDDLKYAAHQLVETVMPNSGTSKNVKVGLASFARHVNVGTQYRNESWLSVPADSSSTSCSMVAPVISSSNCQTLTATSSYDGVPYTYTYQSCDNVYGPEENKCTTTDYTWEGCVGSRNYPLNIEDRDPNTPIPGILGGDCSAPISPMEDNRNMVTTQIDSITSSGDTYIPAGLMWGWRLLSNELPFDEGVSYAAMAGGMKTRKIMVLMTDGVNTASPQYPDHWGTDAALADTLTSELCENIKATGIEIFSIAFDVVDQPTKDMLEACASQPVNYYDAANSFQLVNAFRAIGSRLVQFKMTQ